MSEDYHFEVGDLVRHRHYGYRGAVADRDPECQASEAWYRSNRTQPDRDQPWYHVLVHGAEHSTYVAQENLEPDEGGEQVVHPLAGTVFAHFASGRYVPRDDVRFRDLVSGIF